VNSSNGVTTNDELIDDDGLLVPSTRSKAKRSVAHKISTNAIRLLIAAVILALWQLAYHFEMVSHVFIGSPGGIAGFLYKSLFGSDTLWPDIGITVYRTVVAFLIGSGLGLIAGLLFVVFQRLEEIINPALSALNALPRIALAPLFILWFGIGTLPTILLGVSLTFFAVLSATQSGARSVNPDLLVLCDTLGASKAERFTRVVLPGSVPILFRGFELGLIYALLGVVAGELIAAPSGLGQRVSYLAGTFQSDGVYSVLIVLAVIGALIMWIMSRLEKWLLRWQ
jgi:NitT/TauT family transport system permease protein